MNATNYGTLQTLHPPPTYPHINRLFSQIPVINDDLPMKILSGAVVIKPNVKEIRGSTVVFDDGSVVDKVRQLWGHPQERSVTPMEMGI